MLFEHPVVDRKDWGAFCRSLHPYFSRAIDRERIDLPYWLTPLARGVLVASPTLLVRTRYSGPPWGWTKLGSAVYLHAICKGRLRVRPTNDGRLWLISRWPAGVPMRTDRDSETLVHQFGYTPLLAEHPLAAMHLADWFHCLKQPDDNISGLRWAKATPGTTRGPLCDAIAFADRRARSEGLTISWNELRASSSYSRRMKRGGARYRKGKLLLPVIVRIALGTASPP
jgi:hypothetical protein